MQNYNMILSVKLKRNSGGVGQATCQLGKAYGLFSVLQAQWAAIGQ